MQGKIPFRAVLIFLCAAVLTFSCFLFTNTSDNVEVKAQQLPDQMVTMAAPPKPDGWQEVPAVQKNTYHINYYFPGDWITMTTQPLPTIILALDPTFFPNTDLRVYDVAAGTTSAQFRDWIIAHYPSENGGEYDDFQVLEQGNITLDDGTVTVYMIYRGVRMGYGFEGISVFLVRGTQGFILTGADFPVTFEDSLPLLTQIVKTLHFIITPVSGLITSNTTWTLANSTYVVTGDVIVNYGVRLTIEPGVIVKFDAGTSLQIAGELIARGTDTNPITFTSNQGTPAPGDWVGIMFMDTSVDAQYDVSGNYQSGSILQYCTVEYGGQDDTRTVQISSSSPFIDHNTIRNNASTGIFVEEGSPRIDNNNINNNSNNATDWWTYDGGGISVHSGTATLSNNVINDNLATFGGGVAILGTAILNNNTISGNSVYEGGGGVAIGSNAIATLSNNTIENNDVLDLVEGAGGGIYSYMCTMTVGDTIIYQNSAPFGGGIFFNEGTAIFGYNQITGNTGGSGIYVFFGQPLFNNNNIFGNLPYDVYNGNAVGTPSGETQSCEEQTDSQYDGSGLWGESVLPFAGYNNSGEAPGDIYEVISQDASDVDCTNNWWGTTDEATIQAHIYDNSDDENLGIVNYIPYLQAPVGGLPGDANGDGVVNMGDVTKVERIILGYDAPTPGADANGDGAINMADVTTIELIILGYKPFLAYWPFNEGSGIIAYDAAYANDGDISGASWTAGVSGSALSFDGLNDYVSVPGGDPEWSGDGTVELWLKQDGDTGTLLWKRKYAGSDGWTLYLGFPNTLIGYVNDNATWVQATIPAEEWVHVAMVSEQGIMKLYVNGILRDTKSNSRGFQATNEDLYIGTDENGNYFKGEIDEVALSNNALSAEEVLRHYQNGLLGLGY